MDYKFHFFPDLHANVNLSYDGTKGTGTDVIPENAATNYNVSQDGTYHSGSNSRYKSTYQNELFEGYLSYFKDVKSIKSHFEVIAGYSWQDFKDVDFSYLSYFGD